MVWRTLFDERPKSTHTSDLTRGVWRWPPAGKRGRGAAVDRTPVVAEAVTNESRHLDLAGERFCGDVAIVVGRLSGS
jgi:hypothetical protein